jgi:hypothetical protein
MDIKKRVEEESFKAFPIVENVKGGDCNLRNRKDWVDACKKGVEIMKELMESLKDFDTWKEWKNTDPIEEVEWDDSHELNNVMNQMLEELNEWEIVDDTQTYDIILYKTQNLIPIDDGVTSKHRYVIYEADNRYYRLTWLLNSNETPLIEYKLILI